MQTLSAINLLLIALASIGIYHGSILLAAKLKARGAAKEAIAKASNDNMADLTQALSQAILVLKEVALVTKDASALQEKILIGTTKACEAIAITTEKHRETVISLGRLLLGPEGAKDSLTQPTEDDRDRLAAEMAFRAMGHAPGEAKDLAAAEIERESSLPNF